MKAIQTTYHGPSNTRGSRITATAGSNRVTLSYNHELDSDGNHDAAALALCEKMGWTQHNLMRGTLENSRHQGMGNVYVFDDHGNRLRMPQGLIDDGHAREIARRKARIAAGKAAASILNQPFGNS